MFRVRRARPEDQPHLQALLQTVFPKGDTCVFECMPLQDASQSDMLDEYFVAEESATGRIVGLVLCSEQPYDGGYERYILSDFGVHPDFRRRGIGTQLVKAIYADIAQHEEAVRLEGSISRDAYEFWRKATAGADVEFTELAGPDPYTDPSHPWFDPGATPTSHFVAFTKAAAVET